MIYDDYIVEGYLEEAMSFQNNFGRHYSAGTIHCQCHICGDSKKNTNASRLNAQNYDGTWFVKCYNCGYSGNWMSYLRDYHPSLFDACMHEMSIGKIKALQSPTGRPKPPQISTNETSPSEVPTEIIEPVKGIIFPHAVLNLNDIVETHPIIKYVEHRKIPKKSWDKLFFTNDFRSLVVSVKEMGEGYENYKEPRLVIPIYNEDNIIIGFQGRALKKEDEGIKYMTIKVDDSASKLYGLERVDTTKDILVLEGPLDSLFLDNAIAMTGGSLSLENMPFKDQRVYLLDIEKRHQDTHTRMNVLIDAGERVVLFDKCPWKGKDINDIIMNNDVTIEELEDYIKNNIVSGLEAKMRFNDWSNTNKIIIEHERREDKSARDFEDTLMKIKKMGTT